MASSILYEALGLPFIEPELREGQGEIERLPAARQVNVRDIEDLQMSGCRPHRHLQHEPPVSLLNSVSQRADANDAAGSFRCRAAAAMRTRCGCLQA